MLGQKLQRYQYQEQHHQDQRICTSFDLHPFRLQHDGELHLEEFLPIEKIWNERWLNVTYSMEEIKREILERMRKTHNDIQIILAMQLPCCDQMLSTYLETLDMSKAMEEKHRYEQAQKAKEQIVKPNQEETVPQSKPVVVEKKEQVSDLSAVQQAMPENERTKQQAEETEKVKVLDFRVWVTP